MKRSRIFAFAAAILILLSALLSPFAFAAETDTGGEAAGGLGVFSAVGESVFDLADVISEKLYVGDVDGDGRVNAKDCAVLKRYVCGFSAVAVRQSLDVNGDGRINLKDYLNVKLIICGKDAGSYRNNTTVEKIYDAEKNALCLTVKDAGNTAASFDVSLPQSCRGFSCGALVWTKGDGATPEISAIFSGYSTEKCTDVEIFEDGTGEFSYVIFAAPRTEKTIVGFEFGYDSEPQTGKTLFVDSVIFSETREIALSTAKERAEQLSSQSGSANKAVCFDTAESTALFEKCENAVLSVEDEALKMVSSGTQSSYAVLDLNSAEISADEYKYLVFTSMLQVPNAEALPTGRLTFFAGDAAENEPTEYSIEFSHFPDGAFHSALIDLSDAEFWQGNVQSLKIEGFTLPTVGAACRIKSLIFCKTREDAVRVSVGRGENALDIRLMCDYGIYQKGNMKMAYRLFVPDDYNPGNSYPLLCALHGAASRGCDGVQHLYAAFPLLLNDADDAARDSILFLPQCPAEYRWVEADWTTGKYSVDDTPESEPLKAAVEIIESLGQRFSLDRDRYSVTGYSMGGYGTWDLLMRHGDLFAAGMPLCGGGDTSKGKYLTEIPISVFHGTEDSTVPVYASEYMYKSITRYGGTKITYTPLEGYAHNIWDTVYADDGNIRWLFSQKLSDRK